MEDYGDMDKREVLRFLSGIEEGTLGSSEVFIILQKFDPLLSYFLFKYLREKHPINDSASGAGARLLELLKDHPELSKVVATPKDEPMVEWFEDSFSLKTYFGKPEEYVDLIVDKMEG